MKTLMKGVLGLVITLSLLWVLATVTGHGYLIKALRLTYLRGYDSASINDAAYFDTRTVHAANIPWQWPLHQQYNQNPLPDKLKQTLESTSTVAFLIVKNDSIINEQYWKGYTDSSRSNSFSMAKSIVTMLAQVAVQKGHFTSWQQPVTEILPDIGGPYAPELQLWHLSTMSSGQLWDEHYKNPFSVTANMRLSTKLAQNYRGLCISKCATAFPATAHVAIASEIDQLVVAGYFSNLQRVLGVGVANTYILPHGKTRKCKY